ncbi:MAG: hypothetical protein AAF598_10880 [Bacteroidota bacterium]
MNRFPAKLLLFGEHALLRGALALAIPFERFGGHWAQSTDSRLEVLRSQEALRRMGAYVRESEVADQYDWQAFLSAIDQGWYFDSDIPQGYGLGSSGALVAAFYDQYAKKKATNLKDLRQDLRFIESFYHGSSSGIDPLVSYLGQPIIVHPDQRIEPFEAEAAEGLLSHLFLLDSELPRETGPLVNWFLESMEAEAYQIAFHGELKPAIQSAIEGFKMGDLERLCLAFRQISDWQISGKMQPMVPAIMEPIWQADTYILKVCGAGGGGYFLGLAQPSFDWPEKIGNFNLIPLVTQK